MQKLFWKTERRKASSLAPYKFNPRQITDEQMKNLQRSLKKFNIVELPAIDYDGTIVAGHMRIKALLLLGRGQEEIEVRVPNRKLTKAEFKDYLLTSNRSGGAFDFGVLSEHFDLDEMMTAGFDSDDFSRMFDDNLEITDDGFDEEVEKKKIKHTDIKSGDRFVLGRHHLICGNALDPKVISRLMGDVKADMVDVDPPYNIGLSYDRGIGGKGNYGGKTDDKKTDEEYRAFIKMLMQNALSVAKPDCHCFFWADECRVGLLQELYKEAGLDNKRLCIWIKDNASPTPGVAFNKVTEFCAYATRGKPFLSDKVMNLNEVMNKDMTTGNRLPDEILDQLNIWLVKRLPGNQMQHPTQKSPTLYEKSLRRCSRPGDVVLDLTAGSGTVLSACHQLKRTAYLCELEPLFCQLIINRFKQISHDKITKLKN